MTVAPNALYAQSGGCTAVINATALAVITTAWQHRDKINNVFAAHCGIVGMLKEQLIDISQEDPKQIAALRYTPGSAFGSCRYKLLQFLQNSHDYKRLVAVFKAHNICYLFYNGGGDSQDTLNKIANACDKLGFPMTCIGIPKTIDNDIAHTDNSPGFGSAAKFIAITTRECGLDLKSMALNSTKIFVYEVMGRHSGWLAAASGLAAKKSDQAPHIILFPEIDFEQESFLAKVKKCVDRYGHCVIVAAEGIQHAGKFIANHGYHDAFGHRQLGGVAPILASMIANRFGYKYHWAVADYLQRSASHIVSKTDVKQAYALGQAAVELAIAGEKSVAPTIIRQSNRPYRWSIGRVQLADIANSEKKLPRHYIDSDGFHISLACRCYLQPLIVGESYPTYHDGMPQYAKLKKVLLTKKLTC